MDPAPAPEEAMVDVTTGVDVIDVLMVQHQRIGSALDQVESAVGDGRVAALRSLAALVDVHESVEARLVHPLTSRTVADGAAIAHARFVEEDQVTELLGRLCAMDVNTPRFCDAFAVFRDVLACHIHREEAEEFAPLRAQVDHRQLVELAAAAQVG
jgi:hypothetical protein